jgi:hypothetical protein
LQLSTLPSLVIFVGLLIIVSGAIFLLDRRHKNRTYPRTVVKAIIDIYPSGSHQVQLIPAKGIHPSDLAQLAISYAANMIVCTDGDDAGLRQSLWKLYEVVQMQSRDANETRYREDLNYLANNPEPSLLSSGLYSNKASERFESRLIRGNNFDYTISEFSMIGYKPNYTRTVVLLVNAVKDELDSKYLGLLHECLVGILLCYRDRELSLANNQTMAFSMLEYVLKVMPEPIEKSPGRITRTVA